jgi:hypothetical protein
MKTLLDKVIGGHVISLTGPSRPYYTELPSHAWRRESQLNHFISAELVRTYFSLVVAFALLSVSSLQQCRIIDEAVPSIDTQRKYTGPAHQAAQLTALRRPGTQPLAQSWCADARIV